MQRPSLELYLKSLLRAGRATYTLQAKSGYWFIIVYELKVVLKF